MSGAAQPTWKPPQADLAAVSSTAWHPPQADLAASGSAPSSPSVWSQIKEAGSEIMDAPKKFMDWATGNHPIDAASEVGAGFTQARQQHQQQAVDAYKKGDYKQAAEHALFSVPFVGSMAASAGEEAKTKPVLAGIHMAEMATPLIDPAMGLAGKIGDTETAANIGRAVNTGARATKSAASEFGRVISQAPKSGKGAIAGGTVGATIAHELGGGTLAAEAGAGIGAAVGSKIHAVPRAIRAAIQGAKNEIPFDTEPIVEAVTGKPVKPPIAPAPRTPVIGKEPPIAPPIASTTGAPIANPVPTATSQIPVAPAEVPDIPMAGGTAPIRPPLRTSQGGVIPMDAPTAPIPSVKPNIPEPEIQGTGPIRPPLQSTTGVPGAKSVTAADAAGVTPKQFAKLPKEDQVRAQAIADALNRSKSATAPPTAPPTSSAPRTPPKPYWTPDQPPTVSAIDELRQELDAKTQPPEVPPQQPIISETPTNKEVNPAELNRYVGDEARRNKYQGGEVDPATDTIRGGHVDELVQGNRSTWAEKMARQFKNAGKTTVDVDKLTPEVLDQVSKAAGVTPASERSAATMSLFRERLDDMWAKQPKPSQANQFGQTIAGGQK